MADVLKTPETGMYDQTDLMSGLKPYGFTPGTSSGNSAHDNEVRAYIDRYIKNLTPDQLMQRYQDVSNNGGNLDAYYKSHYGVGDPGNIAEDTNYQTYATMKSMLGRGPTQNEYAQMLPAFQGPNGLINGRAAIANLQQQYKSNPAYDPMSPQNTRNPNDISSSVQQQFQSILGRQATPDELDHFTNAIKTNQTDAYGVSDFLKQQPEYTNAQDKSFRSGLNDELAGYDQQAFDRMKGDVIGDYASRGFSNSPSMDYALTDMYGKLAENRGKYLAGVSSQQYGGNKDLAAGNYKNTLDQMYNDYSQRSGANRQYGQQLMNQGFAGADYQTQRNDYMNFLQNQSRGRGSNPLYGALGGAVGAGIGAFGGPAGAGVGYQIGSGLGNSYGYLNSY